MSDDSSPLEPQPADHASRSVTDGSEAVSEAAELQAPAPDRSSPFFALDAAVLLEGAADQGVPSHYGNPTIEQRTLEAGNAIVDLSSRGVLSVTGPDRLSWLNSITSQELTRLAPGQSTETLFLDQNGRVEHAAKLIDDGVTVWLLVEASEAEPVLSWLTRMRFMLRVEPEDRTAEFATIGVVGDRFLAGSGAASSLPIADPNGVPLVWRDPWTGVTHGGHQYAHGDHPGEHLPWAEVLVPRAALPEIVTQFPAAGSLAAEALRIAAWRPRFASEVDERSIPHELDWLRSAVHLSKGCYRGQETVAKVHNLGHPPRRLVLLHLDGSESVLPAPGSIVRAERQGEWLDVGAVTSSTMHYELGPVALAVIKRGVKPDAPLVVFADDTSIAAAQEVIVPSDAGAVADIPRLPRLGAVKR
ncbi:folate-binding protein YgfZ [Leifsonia sp. ALI-44-B]|uniref:CAF17-like 4Fe-4S cluster assembly/insertion protein YgfZ n=1 Tax=Leifsonia sp. ALI-44-B TaxID=1933776 RepID=UPI0009F877BF|nr:folate-binding protein YgfZ [Leifsonia sp. ALI-44-B]